MKREKGKPEKPESFGDKVMKKAHGFMKRQREEHAGARQKRRDDIIDAQVEGRDWK